MDKKLFVLEVGSIIWWIDKLGKKREITLDEPIYRHVKKDYGDKKSVFQKALMTIKLRNYSYLERPDNRADIKLDEAILRPVKRKPKPDIKDSPLFQSKKSQE